MDFSVPAWWVVVWTLIGVGVGWGCRCLCEASGRADDAREEYLKKTFGGK